jgi:hypothetical protein
MIVMGQQQGSRPAQSSEDKPIPWIRSGFFKTEVISQKGSYGGPHRYLYE